MDLRPLGTQSIGRPLGLPFCPMAPLTDRDSVRFKPLLPVAPMGC
jgi:hypothetical protein